MVTIDRIQWRSRNLFVVSCFVRSGCTCTDTPILNTLTICPNFYQRKGTKVKSVCTQEYKKQ